MRLIQNPDCTSSCRACHYKALNYPEQLQRKQLWALEQLGEWAPVLERIQPAPLSEQLAYRSKTWLRSLFKNGEVSFGMFRAVQSAGGRWGQEFVSWDTCPLHTLPIREITEKLRRAFAQHNHIFSEKTLWGVWMGTPHVVIVVKEKIPLEVLRAIEWSNLLSPPFENLWIHQANQVGRKIFQHRQFQPLSGLPIRNNHPLLAFRQVAQSLLKEARAQALSALLAPQPSLIVDLYCGTGELSLLLPPSTGWIGIELSSDAAAFANKLRFSPGVTHAAFTGSVEQRLLDPRVREKIVGRYSLYLNPPRPGLGHVAQENLIKLLHVNPPETIVYLSCSSSSLARDLRDFEANGYQVETIQPYEFFQQTEHFETLALLRKS